MFVTAPSRPLGYHNLVKQQQPSEASLMSIMPRISDEKRDVHGQRATATRLGNAQRQQDWATRNGNKIGQRATATRLGNAQRQQDWATRNGNEHGELAMAHHSPNVLMA
jgi:hypothetical protein